MSPPARLLVPAVDASDAGSRGSLRSELDAVELELGAVRGELDDQRVLALERSARCHALEQALAAAGRESESEAEYATSELVRSRAIAVADRDRAVDQRKEAVADREAAVRARKRSESVRDEAIGQREAAEERRDTAIAERDEARRQRDEMQVARRALQKQLKHERAQAAKAAAVSLALAAADAADGLPAQPAGGSPEGGSRVAAEAPGGGPKDVDAWAVRVLGATMAACLLTMLLLLLKWLLGF